MGKIHRRKKGDGGEKCLLGIDRFQVETHEQETFDKVEN